MGASSCPGKGLAILDLQSVIAWVLREFHIGFIDGMKLNETQPFKGVKDQILQHIRGLSFVFGRHQPELVSAIWWHIEIAISTKLKRLSCVSCIPIRFCVANCAVFDICTT